MEHGRFNWVSWVALLLTVAGCGSADPGAQRFRVVRASQLNFDQRVTLTYQYDQQGRLARVVEYPDTAAAGPITAQATITYDPAKPTHLAAVDKQLTRPYYDSDGLVVGIRRTYQYDDRDRLTIITESRAMGDFSQLKPTQRYEYIYGEGREPATLTITGPGPLFARDMYTYTFADGNAVGISTVSTTSQRNTPVITQSTVTFDKNPNVFGGFWAVYPGITSFNRNNIIASGVTLFHDSRGLLVRRVKAGAYIDDVTTYWYEAY